VCEVEVKFNSRSNLSFVYHAIDLTLVVCVCMHVTNRLLWVMCDDEMIQFVIYSQKGVVCGNKTWLHIPLCRSSEFW
jgi:hypothetical protein